jgi:VIT1/CCC1 family predicted Fe2+/Mn2+ transporter
MANQEKSHFEKYLGFIALGLSDAIVEITGVHAGFLGVTGSTLIAGIAGVIVGTAAAISMGSAAYLQAKQDPERSSFISGLTTGFSYFFAALFLAFPYFLIHTMVTAFIASSAVGVLILAIFTYQGVKIYQRKFWPEFLETLALLFATAAITYLLGTVVGHAFHVTGSSF